MNIGTACCRRPDCADHSCPGRPDPDLLRQIVASGQMDARQLYEHERAGELLPIGDSHAGIVGYAAADLDGIGYEGADAPRVTGALPPIVTDELRPVREPWSGEAKLLIAAVVLTWLAILALSIADPRDLSTLWPRVLAALSF